MKRYELANHLGNVMAVITDHKVAVSYDDVTVNHYVASVISSTDYYAFGSPVPGRSFSIGSYRYGFNGMERVNELGGKGTHYTAEFWEYDSRIAFRWNTDPKPNKSISPYATFQGNPIWFSDILGDSIDIEGSNGITHRYIPGESYEGEDSFIKNTVKELERLESSGKTGKKLVQNVSDSEEIVTIRKGSDYKASGREITITGSKIRIPVQNRNGAESVEHSEVFILLGHELAHTWDNINKITANDPSLRDLDGYPAEERYALHIENKIRAESGMNLRTHYKVKGA